MATNRIQREPAEERKMAMGTRGGERLRTIITTHMSEKTKTSILSKK